VGIEPSPAEAPLAVGVRLAVLAGIALLTVRYRQWATASWTDLETGRSLRVLSGVMAAVLAWSFATYDYNLYADQTHLADRMSLLALAGLVVWRPGFVLPFVLLLVAMATQFQLPIGPYSTAEPFTLARMLMLVPVALCLQAVTGRIWSREVLYLAVLILATSYLRCGVGKLALDWASHGHIYFLLFATYANGWLAFLDPEAITRLGTTLARFDWIMVGGTLVAECGAVLVFWRRPVLLALLTGWVAFHLGVFLVSGIFFWKWILVDATLIGIFAARGSGDRFPLFTRAHLVLSAPILAAGLWLFSPVNLAWYDTPVSYTHRFVGVGPSGREYSLGPAFFAPFDYTFTLSSFHYLVDHPTLNITWGATWDRDAVEELLLARSVSDISRVEASHGRVPYDPRRAARLDAFLQRFVGTWNQRRSRRTPLTAIQAPPQLWTFPRATAYSGEEPIREVRVDQITTLFDGERYTECRRRELRTVLIPGTEPAASATRDEPTLDRSAGAGLPSPGVLEGEAQGERAVVADRP
jgi:hypothetical protein